MDPYSASLWSRIGIPDTDQDPHRNKKDKLEAKGVRFKTRIHHSVQRQLTKIYFGVIIFLKS